MPDLTDTLIRRAQDAPASTPAEETVTLELGGHTFTTNAPTTAEGETRIREYARRIGVLIDTPAE